MSKRGFCPRGGQLGFVITEKELKKFSDKIGSKFLDEYIPLPNVSITEQKSRIDEDCVEKKKYGMCVGCDFDPKEYWENKDTGSHGWCCCNCGKVLQWS